MSPNPPVFYQVSSHRHWTTSLNPFGTFIFSLHYQFYFTTNAVLYTLLCLRFISSVIPTSGISFVGLCQSFLSKIKYSRYENCKTAKLQNDSDIKLKLPIALFISWNAIEPRLPHKVKALCFQTAFAAFTYAFLLCTPQLHPYRSTCSHFRSTLLQVVMNASLLWQHFAFCSCLPFNISRLSKQSLF